MAKADAVKAKAKLERPEPDGTEGNPLPWVEPFPHREQLDEKSHLELAKAKVEIRAKDQTKLTEKEKSILAHDGREEDPVFVRAKVKQDLLITGGVRATVGQHVVIDSDTAHAHASALGEPDPLPEPAVEEDEDSDADEE